MTQELRERKLRQEIHALRIKKFHWPLDGFKLIMSRLGYGESLRALPEDKLKELKALIQALREYAKNPADTALQSLVSLIKQNQKDSEPSKELNDYIVRFLDQVTDFMIEKGHETLLKQFNGIVIDLAEYLRVRNA